MAVITRVALMAAISVAGSTPVLAAMQKAGSPSIEPIVVTGSRLDPKQVRKEARDFVRQIGAAWGQMPAARWLDPVCPRVIGISAELGERSEQQIKERAEASGARVGPTGCRPNLIVAFAHDGGDLVRRISARRSTALAGVPPPERRKLKVGDAPVRWWYTTQALSRDGLEATAVPPPWSGGNAQGGGSVLPMSDGVSSLRHHNASLISTHEKRAITSATVVIDVGKAEGVPLAAVIDYAAIVGLAELKQPSGTVTGETIFSLFDESSSVRGLTGRDIAFLKTLYSIPLDRQARTHRRQLTNGLVKAATPRE